jgi:hypothetical protein
MGTAQEVLLTQVGERLTEDPGDHHGETMPVPKVPAEERDEGIHDEEQGDQP